MASWYVSNLRGSDSTGDGSASNPWKTWGKAIAGTPAITLSGGTTVDALYVEPGIYYECNTFALSPTSTNTFQIIGDCDGAGFLAGGYSTPATGTVELAGWTNETTTLNTSATLAANAKSYVTIKNIIIRGSSSTGGNGASAVSLTGAWSDWTFQNCEFEPTAGRTVSCWFDFTAGSAANLLVDSCHFSSYNTGIGIELRPPQHTAEYSLNATIRNCRFMGGSFGIRATSTGTSTNLATGILVQNNSFDGTATAVALYTSNSGINITTPIGVYMNEVLFGVTGFSAGNTTHIVENGNAIGAATPRSNVSTGANSITTFVPRVDRGTHRFAGLPPRPYGEPMAGSLLGGFGNYGTPPAADFSGRPRPSGYGSLDPAVGPSERHDTMTIQTGTTQAGSVAGLLGPGPATEEWLVPVAASATTLTIYTNVDTNYGTATPPVFSMDAEPKIGVSALTTTATANTNTWNQLSLGPFTPTDAGYVKVRIKAVPAAATGKCFVDTFAGATGDPSGFGYAYRGFVPKFLSSSTVNNIINVFNSEC